jgi:hypothetical protein
LEHIYTGEMFRDTVEALSDAERTPQKIMQIIQDNYYVAWILKEENKTLPLSYRGKTIDDALSIYEKSGIKLQ